MPGGFGGGAHGQGTQAAQGARCWPRCPDLEATLETVKALAPHDPGFRPAHRVHRPASNDQTTALYDGDIQSVLPDGNKTALSRWPTTSECTNEFVVPQSTAKYTKNKLDSLRGRRPRALQQQLRQAPSRGQEGGGGARHPADLHQPLHEHGRPGGRDRPDFYESIALIDELVETGVELEPLVEPTKFGAGAGATEVPRGILFHEYGYDEEGMCQGGNCIIPTNQNHANIQHDFEKLVPELVAQDKSEKEMELGLEMLVRSYDPCISCSTHYLDVKFVR